MVVQHNLQAMNSNRMLGITQGTLAKSTEKLSSGYKVNRAADDAAGLSISEKMRKQIRGLTQASLNAEDGISSVQTAEGALTEVHDMLQRMNELAVKASNGTNSEGDRQTIQDEIKQLTTEIDRVAETTKFNETYLLKGGKNEQIKTLSAYDAGIKGTLVDAGGANASLTVDLSVGKTIMIAGKNYNIIGDGKEEDENDGIAKIQNDIENNSTDPVTINGTIYTKNADGKYDAGAGITYTVDELKGKVTDGATVQIGTNAAVTARDYVTNDSNITASEAAALINKALTQANNVGASNTAARVVTTKESTDVATINNGGTVTSDETLIAYDKGSGIYKELSAGDITEYVKGGNYEFYKKYKTAGEKVDLNGANYAKDMLAIHSDGVIKGVEKEYTSTMTAAADKVFKDDKGTVADDYIVYEKVDNLLSVATIKNASHEAYAEIETDSANIGVDFKKVADQTTVEDAEKMKAGQNALLDAIEKGSIKFTVTANATANAAAVGVYSHGELDDPKLDIREGGQVYYEDMLVAEMNATAKADITIDDPAKVKTEALKVVADTELVTAEAFVKEGSPIYTFDITKGTTKVAEDLNMNIHVGADADMTNKISIDIASMDAKGLGIYGLNVADDSGMAGTYAVDAIEKAIKTVSAQRSLLGAVQNRLEHTIKNLDNVVENTTSAESAIRDTDMASEMVKYSNNNILSQAGQSMLAQANQSNQGVLSLLG